MSIFRVKELDGVIKDLELKYMVWDRMIKQKIVQLQTLLRDQGKTLITELNATKKQKLDHILQLQKQFKNRHLDGTRIDLADDLYNTEFELECGNIADVIKHITLKQLECKTTELKLSPPCINEAQQELVAVSSLWGIKTGTFTVLKWNVDVHKILETLSETIRREYIRDPSWCTYDQREYKPQVGDDVYVLYGTKKWYRAKLTRVDQHAMVCDVSYTDYGQTDKKVPYMNILEARIDLFNECASQVIECSLVSDEAASKDSQARWEFNSRLNLILNETAGARPLLCRFNNKVQFGERDVWQVDLKGERADGTVVHFNKDLGSLLEAAQAEKGAITNRDWRTEYTAHQKHYDPVKPKELITDSLTKSEKLQSDTGNTTTYSRKPPLVTEIQIPVTAAVSPKTHSVRDEFKRPVQEAAQLDTNHTVESDHTQTTDNTENKQPKITTSMLLEQLYEYSGDTQNSNGNSNDSANQENIGEIGTTKSVRSVETINTQIKNTPDMVMNNNANVVIQSNGPSSVCVAVTSVASGIVNGAITTDQRNVHTVTKTDITLVDDYQPPVPVVEYRQPPPPSFQLDKPATPQSQIDSAVQGEKGAITYRDSPSKSEKPRSNTGDGTTYASKPLSDTGKPVTDALKNPSDSDSRKTASLPKDSNGGDDKEQIPVITAVSSRKQSVQDEFKLADQEATQHGTVTNTDLILVDNYQPPEYRPPPTPSFQLNKPATPQSQIDSETLNTPLSSPCDIRKVVASPRASPSKREDQQHQSLWEDMTKEESVNEEALVTDIPDGKVGNVFFSKETDRTETVIDVTPKIKSALYDEVSGNTGTVTETHARVDQKAEKINQVFPRFEVSKGNESLVTVEGLLETNGFNMKLHMTREQREKWEHFNKSQHKEMEKSSCWCWDTTERCTGFARQLHQLTSLMGRLYFVRTYPRVTEQAREKFAELTQSRVLRAVFTCANQNTAMPLTQLYDAVTSIHINPYIEEILDEPKPSLCDVDQAVQSHLTPPKGSSAAATASPVLQEFDDTWEETYNANTQVVGDNQKNSRECEDLNARKSHYLDIGDSMTNPCYSCGDVGHPTRNGPNRDCARPTHRGRSNSFTPQEEMRCCVCDDPGHEQTNCPMRDHAKDSDKVCNSCNELGHIARNCPARSTGGAKQNTNKGKRQDLCRQN